MPVQLQVTVYVKKDCQLCGPMVRVAEKVCGDLELELEKIDITDDPELLRQYGQEVPVLLIDGKKAFKGSVTPQALKKRLKKSSGKATGHEAPVVEALELIEPPPYVPPRPVIVLLAAVTVAAFLYLVGRGVADAGLGRGRLAAQLLQVVDKDYPPSDFTLPALDGGQLSLSSLRDRVVFLNFWATWCPPCIEEMPSMYRLYDKLQSEDRYAMIAVSADEGWDPVRRFLGEKPPGFKVLLDKGGDLAKRYGTEKFPETYVIADGKVVGYIIGPRDWDTWYAEAYLRSVLERQRARN